MAMQRVGDADFAVLLAETEAWADGSALERRAAVAALCEPRLLRPAEHARAVLALLARITGQLPSLPERGSDAFRVLRQALGYGWSVAVVALPEEGKAAFEQLLASDDRDIRWVVRENLRKRRLDRMDAAWAERLRERVAARA